MSCSCRIPGLRDGRFCRDRQACLEKSSDPPATRAKKHNNDNDMSWLKPKVNPSFSALMSERSKECSLENRIVPSRYCGPPTDLRVLQAATQQRTGQLGSASLENHMKPIEFSTTEQTAGDLQALETTTEQAARDLATANDRQATIENRAKHMEKSTTEETTDVTADVTRGQKPPSTASLSQWTDITADVPADVACLEALVEPNVRSTTEQIAGELEKFTRHALWATRFLQALSAYDRPEIEAWMGIGNRVESFEHMTKEHIAGELRDLQIATANAARDLVSTVNVSILELHKLRTMTDKAIAELSSADRPAVSRIAWSQSRSRGSRAPASFRPCLRHCG